MKFKPKMYAGKDRVMIAQPGQRNSGKAWVWNKEVGRYDPAPLCYRAYRYEMHFGQKRRAARFFETLDAAREWRDGHDQQKATTREISNKGEVTLADVWENFQRYHIPTIVEGSQVIYRRYWRLYISKLGPLPMSAINIVVVDEWIEWIEWMKQTRENATTPNVRSSFKHELIALSGLVSHYRSHYRPPNYPPPIADWHYKAVVVREVDEKDQGLTRAEFEQFLKALDRGTAHARTMIAFATAQFARRFGSER